MDSAAAAKTFLFSQNLLECGFTIVGQVITINKLILSKIKLLYERNEKINRITMT